MISTNPRMPNNNQVRDAYDKYVNGSLEDDHDAWKCLLFSACCYMRDTVLVDELLCIGQKKGYSPCFIDAYEGTTPMHRLCALGDSEMLRILVCSSRTDIMVTDKFQCNLLHVIAASAPSRESNACLQILQDYSAKKVCEMAEQKDFYGNTPILLACRCRTSKMLNTNFVDSILSMVRNDRKPILLQAKKPNGETALHIAAKALDKDTTRFLLSRGSKQLRDENHRIPLESAIFSEQSRASNEALCTLSCLLNDFVTSTRNRKCCEDLSNICWKAVEDGAKNRDNFLRIFALSFPTMLCECLENIQDSAGNNILHIAASPRKQSSIRLSTLVLLLDILGCEQQNSGSLLERTNKRRSQVEENGRRSPEQSFGISPLDLIVKESPLMSGSKRDRKRLVAIISAHNREKAKELERRLFPRTLIPWDIDE